MTSIQPALKPKVKHNNWPIVVGILIVLVAVGIGYLVMTTSTTAPEPRNPLAINPELKVVSLYERVVSAPSLAENPELIVLQHYTAVQTERVERNVLAVNPELTAVQHFVAARSEPRNELAVNPELSCYYRYANK